MLNILPKITLDPAVSFQIQKKKIHLHPGLLYNSGFSE